jgi:predicted dehydrogenase
MCFRIASDPVPLTSISNAGTGTANAPARRSVRRVLFVALGSIGRRHLANLRQLEPDAEPILWRPHSGPSAVERGESCVASLDEALAARADVAIISAPAPWHLPFAQPLAEQGVPLFIEKPLAHSLTGVDALLHAAQSHGTPLMVGYNLRFSATLQAARQMLREGRIGRLLSLRAEAGQYLPDWRAGSDYREGVSARAELGGGALLELSHELDYTRWLAGDEVTEVTARLARLGALEIDVEDTAELLLQFAGGVQASVHLDMLQRAPHRTCRLIGTEGTLAVDLLAHRIECFSVANDRWDSWTPLVPPAANDTYLAELRHFLDCAATGAIPAITGEDGRRVLQIVEAARQSSAEKRTVIL